MQPRSAAVLGRAIAARTAEILGQQIIIENVAGAGGMTGSARVAKAPPDGYQFVLGSAGTHAANQTLYKHPLYNAMTDFTPVMLVVEQPIASTWPDRSAAVRAFASGIGSSTSRSTLGTRLASQ